MGVGSFRKYMVVEILGSRYMLKRKLDGACWQLENTENYHIEEKTEAELHQLYIEHKCTILVDSIDTPRSNVHRVTLSDDDTATIASRKKYVLAVLDLPSTKSVLKPAIRQAWLDDKSCKRPKKCPGCSTVSEWKVTYLQSGKDDRALLDRNYAKGNRVTRFHQIVLDICRHAIEEKYMRREQNSQEEALQYAQVQVQERQKILDQEYETQKRRMSQYHQDASLLKRVVLQRPTRRFVQRLIAQIPEFDKWAARHGLQSARNKFRSVKGHLVADAPLHIVQLDHTLLDLTVVDEEGRVLAARGASKFLA